MAKLEKGVLMIKHILQRREERELFRCTF